MLRIAPTNLQGKLTSNLDDYGKKASIKRGCNKKGRVEMPLPLKNVLVRIARRIDWAGMREPMSFYAAVPQVPLCPVITLEEGYGWAHGASIGVWWSRRL